MSLSYKSGLRRIMPDKLCQSIIDRVTVRMGDEQIDAFTSARGHLLPSGPTQSESAPLPIAAAASASARGSDAPGAVVPEPSPGA